MLMRHCFEVEYLVGSLESDRSASDINYNNQLMQLCTARTAWSESDQAVWAVHSCNSW